MLDGRTALVTGAAKGIGRAIALRLAADGADVAVNYRGSEAEAQSLVQEIEGMGRKARAYQADVADYAAADQMVDAVIADFGQVDVLVNNASIGSSGIGRPTITESTQEQVDLLMGANLLGPINQLGRAH